MLYTDAKYISGKKVKATIRISVIKYRYFLTILYLILSKIKYKKLKIRVELEYFTD